MKKYLFAAFSAAFILASCERIEANPELSEGHEAVEYKTITVHSTLEQPSDPAATKTSLTEDNMVVWNEGDCFSIASQTGVGTPLTLNDIKDLADGSRTKVVLVGTSTASGCVLGSDGSSTLSYPETAGMSSASAMRTAALEALTQEGYVMTLVKVSSTTVQLINSSGNYLYRTASSGSTSGYVWSASDSYTTYTVSNPSSVSSSDFASGVNLNSCIQFYMQNSAKTSSYYLNSETLFQPTGSNSIGSLTTENGVAATSWYVYPYSEASSAVMEITSAGSFSAEFSGSVTDTNADYYAIYPYASTNIFVDGTLYFNLPQTQTYAAGSFASGANPSVGHLEKIGDDYDVSFKNVCGVLRLSLKGSGVVNAIKVKDASGASLWGSASVSADKIGTDQGYATVTGGSDEITLDCGGVRLSTDVATQFNIVVPVGAFASGFTLTIDTSIGSATKSATVSNTIRRSIIKTMPAFSADRLEYTVPEFNIENPTAADYMANSYSTFSASYMSTSTFTNNRSAAYDLGYRNDQPNMKTITFSSPSATQATVQMSTDSGFGTMVLNSVVSLSDGTGSYVFGNMVPGTTYYYRVLSGDVQTGGDVPSDVDILTAGCFKAVGQLRMIRVDDGWNVRDEGGWTGWNGNKVRYENIYRGGSLGGTYNGTTDTIGDVSQKELQRIGIKAQLDLRPTYGVPSSYMNWVGSSTGAYSLGYSPIPGAEYQQIVTDWGLKSALSSAVDVGDLAYIIKSVKAGKPVYFHCRTGADRTGTVGYLLLALLGCDAYEGGNGGNQLAMDYELTSLSMDEDGTIAYNNGTRYTSFSDRQASEAASSTYGYKFFYQLRTLYANGTYSGTGSGSETIQLTTFQERAYYYLNRYFYDNTVSTAGSVYISKSDLDWFINYMLGIVELDGTIASGHTSADLFVGPSWALEHTGYTLDNAISTAVAYMYTSASNGVGPFWE